jgi:flagellar hook-basal body complex protein FliE
MKTLPVASSTAAGLSGFGQADQATAGFAEKLKAALEEVNDLQQRSQRAVQDVVSGKIDVHEGMMALAKADISLRMMLQVRNKAIDAYQEIMRISF